MKYAFKKFSREIDKNNLGYVDADEYLKLVTNCCKVEIDIVGRSDALILRVFGQLSDYVMIPKLKKSDVINKSELEIQDLVSKIRYSDHFIVAVTNCGRAYDPFN